MSTTSICSTTIVPEALRKDNYEIWKYCIKNYLLGQDLWEVVEENTQPPNEEEGNRKEWRRKNGAALHAIQISCSPHLLDYIKEKTDAKDAWVTLADMCENTVEEPDIEQEEQDIEQEEPHIEQEEPDVLPDLSNCGLATLRKDNYRIWKACMKDFLLEKDLWEFVEDETVAEENEDWIKRNKEALHAIRVQCSPDLLEQIKDKTTAKDAWDTLAAFCKPPTSKIEDLRVGRTHALTLMKAIHNNDLDFVKSFFNEHPDLISARFECHGQGMALQYATIGESLNIVEELIGKISDEDANKDDGYGTSALSYASNAGGMRMVRIAERLIRKNKEMLTIPDQWGKIPLTNACYCGHKNMAYYLYSLTPHQFLASKDGTYQAALIICSCIDNKMFDIALDLFRICPHLVQLNHNSPLIVLSNRHSAFPSGIKLQFWQQWIYSSLKVNSSTTSNEVNVCSLFFDHDQTEITKIVNQEKLRLGGVSSGLSYFLRISGIKQIYDLKVTHMCAHQLLLLMSKTISTLAISQLSQSIYDAIFNAAKLGMTEFLVEVIGANPDLLFAFDENRRSIFHMAVVYRQEKVFSLIFGVGSLKSQLSSFLDINDDSLLHLAGHPPPQRLFGHIAGAAFQMQKEIQWFKEVESIVPKAFKQYLNANGKTPLEIFEESHKGLLSDGQKWMKEIAQSSTVVGALIITIMFAALYTVPGGIDEYGHPLLLTQKAFKVFIVSDAISLFASSTSVLMFLGILTSRYSNVDFLESFHITLIIALSSLFISIATMMVAFSATVVIMLKGKLSYIIPIVLLASIPLPILVWLQSPLLVTIFQWIYRPRICDRKMKKWIKNTSAEDQKSLINEKKWIKTSTDDQR